MTAKTLEKPVQAKTLSIEQFNKMHIKLTEAFDALLDSNQRWAYKAQAIGNIAHAQDSDYNFRDFPRMIAYLGNDLSDDLYKSPEMTALIQAMELVDKIKEELSEVPKGS